MENFFINGVFYANIDQLEAELLNKFGTHSNIPNDWTANAIEGIIGDSDFFEPIGKKFTIVKNDIIEPFDFSDYGNN